MSLTNGAVGQGPRYLCWLSLLDAHVAPCVPRPFVHLHTAARPHSYQRHQHRDIFLEEKKNKNRRRGCCTITRRRREELTFLPPLPLGQPLCCLKFFPILRNSKGELLQTTYALYWLRSGRPGAALLAGTVMGRRRGTKMEMVYVLLDAGV